MVTTVEEFITAVNAETNRIADAFNALLAKANTPAGLNDTEQTQADALIAHLHTIGADPANPVPPAPVATGLTNPV